MIMSTISNAMLSPEPYASNIFLRLGRILENWWMAYVTWRLEGFAIRQLQSMSDRELKDIGVSRAAIGFAVKVGTDRLPMPAHY
jgi:uncharacterized protein YjiS (DUF1127 family)